MDGFSTFEQVYNHLGHLWWWMFEEEIYICYLPPPSCVDGLPSSSLFQYQYIIFYTWGDYFNFITSLVGSGEESAYHLVASHFAIGAAIFKWHDFSYN